MNRILSVTTIGAILISSFPAMAQSRDILAGSGPVAAQSSALLAGAERAVTEALAEQEEQGGTVIRRPRSTGMAKFGVALLAAGGVMVLVPQTETETSSFAYGDFRDEYTYTYTSKGYLTYGGFASMAVGGVLIWRGLGMVEVPFRVDLTPGSGFRASRSFGW